jgi:hypothetical protein
LEVSAATYHRWQHLHGGMKATEDARIDVNPPGRPICRCRKVAAAGS